MKLCYTELGGTERRWHRPRRSGVKCYCETSICRSDQVIWATKDEKERPSSNTFSTFTVRSQNNAIILLVRDHVHGPRIFYGQGTK